MKRLFTLTVLLVFASLYMVSSSFAEESQPTSGSIKVGELLTWATATPPDWGRGALLAGMGLVGALVTIFGLIGGVVPGTAGQAQIDADTARLKRLSEELEKLITASTRDPATITAVEATVNNLRDDLRAERWRQFAIATLLYAILGAAVSTLLASDVLQALVIGAGWTGLLGSLGLKRDYAERKELKDTALERTVERAEKAEALIKGTGDAGLIAALPDDPWQTDVRVARAL